MPDPTGPSFRLPSAYLPLALSLSALAFMITYVAVFGVSEPGGDEGGPARLFQLIMLIQLPIMGYFALRWLPGEPRQGLVILALQILAWVTPVALIIFLESTS
jgi:hypothetical protein